ncbi:MAG: hypothetical protein JXA43_01935 [Candidatus Diapherotrites archaeon]|nr:hypothetical protein [Candidatus Diapherotrites archaeon]
MGSELDNLKLDKTKLDEEVALICKEFKDMPSNLSDITATIDGMLSAIGQNVFINRELASEIDRAVDAIVTIKAGTDPRVSDLKCKKKQFDSAIDGQTDALARSVAEEIAVELKSRGANGDLADIVAGSIDVTKEAVSGESPIGYNFAGYFDKTNEYGPKMETIKDRIVGRMVENYTLKYPISGKYDPIHIIEAACGPEDIRYDRIRRPEDRVHFDRRKGWVKTTWKCAIEEKKHKIKFSPDGDQKKEWENIMTKLLGKDQEIRKGIKHIQFNFSKAKITEKIIRELEHADNKFKLNPNSIPEKLVTELSRIIYDGKVIGDSIPAYVQDCVPRKVDQEALVAVTAMVNNKFCRAVDMGHDIGATTYATLNQLSSLICDVNNDR